MKKRTAANVGAITWINRNPKEAIQLGLTSIDVDQEFGKKDGIIFEKFLDEASLHLQDLVSLGKEAITIGTLLQVDEKSYEVNDDLTLRILRSVKAGWRQPDGTQPQSFVDDTTRYDRFTTWKDNSCVVDVVIFIAIMLDSGRCQIDQIPATTANDLPFPALITRSIACTLWGELTDDARSGLRDLLADKLEVHNPDSMKKGGFLPISEVVDTCFDGLPQMSYTMVRGTECCDGIVRMDFGRGSYRRTAFNILTPTRQSFQRCVDDFFETKVVLGAPPCTRGVDCSGTSSSFQLIVDRLPPTLLFHLGANLTKAEATGMRLSADLLVRARDTREVIRQTYKCIGIVIFANNNHFFVRWMHQGTLVQYDGFQNKVPGKLKSKTNFFTAWEQAWTVVTVIFRQIEEEGLGGK